MLSVVADGAQTPPFIVLVIDPSAIRSNSVQVGPIGDEWPTGGAGYPMSEL